MVAPQRFDEAGPLRWKPLLFVPQLLSIFAPLVPTIRKNRSADGTAPQVCVPAVRLVGR